MVKLSTLWLAISAFLGCAALEVSAALVPTSRFDEFQVSAYYVNLPSEDDVSHLLSDPFDHAYDGTSQSAHIDGWQHTSVSATGFSVSAGADGIIPVPAASGPPGAAISTLVHFDITFYVDSPEILTLSGLFSRVPLAAQLTSYFRTGPNAGLAAERLWNYTATTSFPASFTIDPAYSYRFVFQDEDSVDSFGIRPRSFTYSEQVSAQLSPVPEPSSAALVVSGVMLATLAIKPRRARLARAA